MLVDSHCHLDFPEFAGRVGDVIAEAQSHGVERLVTICTRVKRFSEILAIAEAHEPVFCSVGTHPHNASEETDIGVQELLAHTGHPKVVALGEVGLDFHYKNAEPSDQERSFRAHIAVARQTGLPVVIHCRDADQDMVRILKDEMQQGTFKAVLHCFSGGRSLAEEGVSLGLYVSFSGILTFKNAADIRDIAAALPLDRLLVETDAPFLAPVPMRGKPCEPAFVRFTAAQLGGLHGVSEDEMARISSDNFFSLFDKVPDPRAAWA